MSNQLAGAAAISRAQGLTKISAQSNFENQNQKNDMIKLMKENEVLRKNFQVLTMKTLRYNNVERNNVMIETNVRMLQKNFR